MGKLTTTVEGVQSTVLVGVDLEDLAVNLESGVLDSVGVASGNTAQVRVLLVDLVVGGIVETEDDVALNTVDVLSVMPYAWTNRAFGSALTARLSTPSDIGEAP